eukprot:jgi/Psemu1/28886/gm1.28886_g
MYQQKNYGKNATPQDVEDKESKKEQRQKEQWNMIETLGKDDKDYKYPRNHIQFQQTNKAQKIKDQVKVWRIKAQRIKAWSAKRLGKAMLSIQSHRNEAQGLKSQCSKSGSGKTWKFKAHVEESALIE